MLCRLLQPQGATPRSDSNVVVPAVQNEVPSYDPRACIRLAPRVPPVDGGVIFGSTVEVCSGNFHDNPRSAVHCPADRMRHIVRIAQRQGQH